MRAVWKYVLEATDKQWVKMPFGAKPLLVACQGMDLCLWMEVDTDMAEAERVVYVVGTGNPFLNEAEKNWVKHAGSALMMGGRLVWHVYLDAEKQVEPWQKLKRNPHAPDADAK
jgi:hypothetical protein